MSLATLAADLPGTYHLSTIERGGEYTYTAPVTYAIIINVANVVGSEVIATGTQGGIGITLTLADSGGGVTFVGTLAYDTGGSENINDFFLLAPLLRYRTSQAGKSDLIHLYDKQ